MKFIGKTVASLWFAIIRMALMLIGLALLCLSQSPSAPHSDAMLLMLLGAMLFLTGAFFRLLSPWMKVPLKVRQDQIEIHERPLRPPRRP